MKYRILPPLLSAVLLCGCTDIRTRLSPDLLAADTGDRIRLAAHTTQADTVITAEAAVPRLLPEALRNAAGAEISTGHISMLLIHGEPCALLETALQQQWLPPTGTVLLLQSSACDALRNGTAPADGQLAAAAETGMLPARAADTVLGDLWGGSGITAFPAAENGSLTLSLRAPGQDFGTLSGNACRGLALLGNRWKSFSFPCGEAVCRVERAALQTAVTEHGGRLCITVSGTVRAEDADPDTAAAVLTELLLAALHETARDTGADILFLREYAVRGGIHAAKSCSQAEWAAMLRQAEYRVRIAVRG